MKLGTEDKKRLIQAAIAIPLALIGLVYLYVEVFGGSSPAPAPLAVSSAAVGGLRQGAAGAGSRATGAAAKRVATSPTRLDPTLHPEVMAAAESLIYTGNGRNIFSASAAPVVIEKPIASARPVAPAGPAVYTPPPPPPIDLKFFGTETTEDGKKKAFLLHGEDVFIAAAGDIVDRRYRVLQILVTSVEVEDLSNNNKQMLPLTTN